MKLNNPHGILQTLIEHINSIFLRNEKAIGFARALQVFVVS